MISAVDRLRLNPCLPVEQNAQSSTQPAWLETHSVPRPVSGMNTASTALAPSTLMSHLRVSSAAVLSPTACGGRISADSASRVRRLFAMSVMAAKSLAPRWWIQCSTCRARNGFSPIAAKYRSRPARSKSSRLTFIGGGSARKHLAGGKEIRDLHPRRVRRVGAMHRVGIDRRGKVGANRAGCGLFRIGRPHQLAIARNGVLALQHLHQYRTGNHEFDQILEERPLAVHR